MSNNDGIEPAANINPPAGITEIMMQMQHQQLQLQQQMTNLMSQFIAPTNANNTPEDKSKRSTKPTRPTIDADSSDNKWIIFKDSWNRYKEMAGITDEATIRNELRSTCTPKVNEMLFNFVGPEALNNATEENLLDHIKSIAVKAVHPEVYRQQFFNLRQSDCETVTSFISRLKAQAMLCAFQSKGDCGAPTCSSSYAADMIRSQLIAGIRNATHQTKVLTEIATLKTLEQLTTRLLALEATDRASSQFRSPFENTVGSGIAPIKSIQKSKIPYSKKLCPGCGKPLHLNGRASCPAWQKTCHKCKRTNHFATVCRSSSVSTITEANDMPDEEVSQLSAVKTHPL